MMNSNFFGCSTGRSAGLAPLRILSTYVAARRSKSVCDHAVGHKPPGFDKIFQIVIYGRQPEFCRVVRNLFSLRIENSAGYHKDCVSTPLLAARNAVSISLGSSMSRY